jgi:hypothetical protein
MKNGLKLQCAATCRNRNFPATYSVPLQGMKATGRFPLGLGGILFVLCLGIGSVTLQATDGTKEKPKKLTVDQMIKIIKDKNIFKPAKVPPPSTTSDPGNFLAPDQGPKRLKNPFTVIGIQAGEGELGAHLLFKDPARLNPDRIEKATVGNVFEDTLEILAIEWPFLRCDYAGQEVRIYQNESTHDALARLRGFDSSYILLGTRAAGDQYVAEVLILRDNTVKIIEQGDRLGDATVTKIEEGKMHLVDPDGTEYPIE